MRPVAWIALVLFSNCACADFSGKVINVADGDTITVLRNTDQIRVRLTEIDAPEKRQSFGSKSRHSLHDICLGKIAFLREFGVDRYGRTLGRVSCAGVDANAEQVRRGMAWVYDRYVTDRSLYRLQEEARSAKRGLWSDVDPMPPWEFRKKK